VYFDTAYIAKFYREEPESESVRTLVIESPGVLTSAWAFTELHVVLHRHVREGSLAAKDARLLAERFASHIEAGIWRLLPVTEGLLRQTGASLLSAPNSLFLRAGDALHLQTARAAGEKEIWTNDRRMLAAAKHFGLEGRSI
jgi:predicted nucleic acid-binding protein